MEKGKTNTREIHLHQCRQTVEPIVECRYITAHDQKHDPAVVELVAPLGDLWAVIAQRVVRRTHAQAGEGAREETCKHHHVRLGGAGVARDDDGLGQVQRHEAEDGEDEGAEEVCPDVYGLVVQGEEREERAIVAVAGRPIPCDDEGVVPAPVGEFLPCEEEGRFDLLLDGLDGVQEAVG